MTSQLKEKLNKSLCRELTVPYYHMHYYETTKRDHLLCVALSVSVWDLCTVVGSLTVWLHGHSAAGARQRPHASSTHRYSPQCCRSGGCVWLHWWQALQCAGTLWRPSVWELVQVGPAVITQWDSGENIYNSHSSVKLRWEYLQQSPLSETQARIFTTVTPQCDSGENIYNSHPSVRLGWEYLLQSPLSETQVRIFITVTPSVRLRWEYLQQSPLSETRVRIFTTLEQSPLSETQVKIQQLNC